LNVIAAERPLRPAALVIGWLTAMLVAAAFTVASYPGFMSFDSIEALRQARFKVEGSQYPPFGSYVWRVFDWIWPGPSLMQLFQNGLLLSALALVLNLLRWPVLAQMGLIVGICLLPPITGTMLVVWKDVAVAAFYLAGFATLFYVRQCQPRLRSMWIGLGIVLIFFGMAYRFNAASGAAPLLVYACWLYSRRGEVGGRWVRAVVAGSVLLLSLFAMVWVVNSFRFPTFERLERNTNIDSIRRHDLIGISRYSGQSMMPGVDGRPIDVEYLRKIYDARHLNITSMNDVEGRLPKQESHEIRAAWMSAVQAHPLAYLRHRAEIMREYIALHGHDVFYVTHPSVDQNQLGVTHEPTQYTRKAVGHVWELRNSLLNRAWVYYLTAIAVVAWLASRARALRPEALTVLLSGLLYLAPMYFITPAGDVRYNFWSLWGALLALVFAVTAPFVARKRVARGD
jgi:hypothetical protein